VEAAIGEQGWIPFASLKPGLLTITATPRFVFAPT
jgi:hypothetical protein